MDGWWEKTLLDSEYLSAIDRDMGSLIDVASRSLDRPVSACPGWHNGRLLSHVGSVLHFWNELVKQRSLDASTVERAPRRLDEELAPWVRDVTADLLATLKSTPRDTEVWTWTGPQPVSWVVRRVAHEVAVHSVDAHHGAGAGFEVESSLASDGIDEFLFVHLPQQREGQPSIGGSVHLHCTDVDGEWMVREADVTSLVVTREHAKGSCAIRGRAHDILMALWRRSTLDAVEVIGDIALAERFVARTDLD